MNGGAETFLRRVLLGTAGAMCLGTIVELGLADHAHEPLQVAPFILCGLGLIAVIAFWLRPSSRTAWAVRVTMALAALGAVIGVAVHVLGNQAFVLETRPGVDSLLALWLALRGGAPALAPGILAITAALAVAATHRHPAVA